MADAPLLAMDVLQWARHHRCFPGQGHFDVENFFEQVLRAGYAGPLSLEIFNDLFRETPNRRTATDAMRSLLYLESQARRRLRDAAAGWRRAGAGRRRVAPSCSIRRRRRACRACRSSNSRSTSRMRRRSAGCSSSSAFAWPAAIAASRRRCTRRAASA